MVYEGGERRRDKRIPGRFVISYRVPGENYSTDISQTKNISLGGVNLITARQLEVGTELILEIRLPAEEKVVLLNGRVKESKEIAKDLIYDTRLEFLDINEKQKDIINQAEKILLKNNTRPSKEMIQNHF